MRKINLILILICAFYISQAQSIRKTIGFIPYTDPEQAEAEYRELAYKNIYDAAVRVFTNTQRFQVLDRSIFNILKIEKEFQKGEDLANVEIIAQGRIAAAELLAVAKLSTFTISESDDGDGFSVFITAEFKQIDVETGEAIDAFQLRAEALDAQETLGIKRKRITTIEEAISKAVHKMEVDMEKWIKTNFRMILKVNQVMESDNIIVVEGGYDVGLTTKNRMKAITLKTLPNGKNLTQTIAKLNFTREGVGEDLTLLKISSKKDWPLFMKKWRQEKDQIYVTEDF